jgi:hypothetical protein
LKRVHPSPDVGDELVFSSRAFWLRQLSAGNVCGVLSGAGGFRKEENKPLILWFGGHFLCAKAAGKEEPMAAAEE